MALSRQQVASALTAYCKVFSIPHHWCSPATPRVTGSNTMCDAQQHIGRKREEGEIIVVE